MNTIVTTPMLPRRVRHTPQSAAYTDMTREARDYGIRHAIHIEPRMLREYDAYPSGSRMTTPECVASLLSYALHCEPETETFAVILYRTADNRPVEIILNIVRQRDEQERLFLRFAQETEI